MLHLLSEVLSEFGYEVTSLHSDDAVVDAVELLEPMAIICDELEGVFNGERLYGELEARGLTREIAFIILSDSLDSGRTARCLNAGVEEFINKPFSTEELNARIRKAVRHRRSSLASLAGSTVDVESGFRGNLEIMDLPDLVLNLNQNMRSGVLCVDVEDGTYRFDFCKGELAKAVGPGGIVGRKAFFRAIRRNIGFFRFVPSSEIAETLPAELMGAGHLLLSGVQEADEFALARRELKDGLLSLTSVGRSKASDLPLILLPLLEDVGRPMTVTELIDACPRTDLESVLELLECMKQEVVVGYDTESPQSA